MVSSNATRPLGPQRSSASQPSSSPSLSRPSSPREPSSQPSSVEASSQPVSSVPPLSQSTESTQPTKKIIKRRIIVKTSGAVVGENQAKWKSRSGHFIRSHIPIRYHDWRIVLKTFKDDVWKALMGEFDLNIKEDNSPITRKRIFSKIQDSEEHIS